MSTIEAHGYSSAVTAKHWVSRMPTLRKLTTLSLHCSSLSNNADIRALSFAHIADHLVHSAPSLRFLFLPDHEWLEQRPQLLAVLGQLTELRGLWLGETKWMQQGILQRCWAEGRPMWPSLSRVAPGAGEGVWRDQTLPQPTWPWRVERDVSSKKMRGGARPPEDV